MLINSPFIMMTSLVMVISSLLAMSSTNWLFLWLGLELNLLSFIPLIMYTKSFQETEASIKYFLAQALGSSILLMSSMSLWFSSSNPNMLMYMLIISALILKLGMAPCHLWYPSVMASISWFNCLVLSTWQKLAPLAIASFLVTNSMYILLAFIAGLNAITGGLMGLNQSHLRTIMAYSSITHLGWMFSLVSMNKPILALVYFMLYSSIITPMFLMFNMKSIMNSNQMNKIATLSPTLQILIPILLISLSGMPPFTGFMPKWLTISTVSTYNYTLVIVLIMGSMMNTYFYLNILFNTMLSSQMNQMTIQPKMYTPMKLLTLIAISSLFFLPILLI